MTVLPLQYYPVSSSAKSTLPHFKFNPSPEPGQREPQELGRPWEERETELPLSVSSSTVNPSSSAESTRPVGNTKPGKGLFTHTFLCLAIDIVEYVLN